MQELTLEARPREAGKNPRLLRRSGYVPAVVYGRGREPQSIAVEAKALAAILDLAGRHHVVTVGGQATLVQEVQRESTTGRLLHVDFHAVVLGEKVHAELPLRVRGEEKLHKVTGAIVQRQLTELRVACRPSELPDYLTVDVADLKAGESVTVGDLTLPAGVESLQEAAEVVISILAPRVEAAGTEAAAATPAPEVVGKRGKSESDGE